MAQRRGFGREQRVEPGGVDLGAFEQRPGVAVGIGRVDPADEILRQTAFRLEPVERLERRGGDHASEIENDGFEGAAHRRFLVIGLDGAVAQGVN